MARRAFAAGFIVLLGASCKRGVAPSARPDPIATTVAASASSTVRSVDVGDGVIVEATELVPGRYANATHVSILVHPEGMNVVSTQGSSAFVLTFGASGSVDGCRSKRSDSHLDGPKVATESHSRDRQGYRGKWHEQGGWIEVDLELDDGVCAQLRPYVDLAPKPWRLRCLSVRRVASLVLVSPALICQLTNRTELEYEENGGHLLSHILSTKGPGEWLVLGMGNGLDVTWKESGTGLFTEKNAIVTVAVSPTPVTWDDQP